MSGGDGYSEVSYESWFSRIGKAFGGIIVGVILFLVSFAVLWWNEGRAVQTAQSLTEGKGAVVSVNADKVDAGNDGMLVHVTGKAITEGTPADPSFKVAAPQDLILQRHVEMYLWKEHKSSKTKKLVGGETKTVTTYTYEKIWSPHAIKSSEFKQTGTHANPDALPFRNETWTADKVTLGAFTLSPDLVQRIGGQPGAKKKLAMTDEIVAKLPEDLKNVYKVNTEGYLYRSKSGTAENAGEPAIGDVRIWYMIVPAATVSILAEQSKDSFRPYSTKAGVPLERVELGEHTAAQMFEAAEAENNNLTWILRLVGWILMAMGIFLVFRPLVVIMDVIPFLGELASTGLALFAGLIALMLSLVTIAVAWIVYRPVLGIGLLVGAAVVAGAVIFLLSKRKTAAKMTS